MESDPWSLGPAHALLKEKKREEEATKQTIPSLFFRYFAPAPSKELRTSYGWMLWQKQSQTYTSSALRTTTSRPQTSIRSLLLLHILLLLRITDKPPFIAPLQLTSIRSFIAPPSYHIT